VFPFLKFPGADPILGPEMKSTGEVMATGRSFAEAYSKARQASGVVLPDGGSVIISVRDRDKPAAVEVGRDLQKRGFNIIATGGTEVALREAGVPCQRINKVREGRPHIVDAIKNGNIDLIINTTEGKQAINESHEIRREAVRGKITYYTTVSGAKAGALALDYLDALDVNCLQALHKEIA
jgi:carbamoyl-phosphate synthase large subunit